LLLNVEMGSEVAHRVYRPLPMRHADDGRRVKAVFVGPFVPASLDTKRRIEEDPVEVEENRIAFQMHVVSV
jgi:hypothetical protein